MLPLAFVALAGGVVLMVAGVTGSSVASAAQGHPDKAHAGKLPAGGQISEALTTGTSTAHASSAGSAGQTVYDYLTSQGLTPAQAAGVIGNLQQESSLDPNAPGGGLAQWIGARWSALEAFARHQGASPNSAALQAEYLWHELTTTERGSLLALKRTTTPQQAARVFSEQFERPGVPMLANRERYAREALHTYGRQS